MIDHYRLIPRVSVAYNMGRGVEYDHIVTAVGKETRPGPTRGSDADYMGGDFLYKTLPRPLLLRALLSLSH